MSLRLLRWPLLLLVLGLALMCLGLSGCNLPQVRAEDRIFLNLSLDYLGEFRLPAQDFQGTKVGGLSGLAYDHRQDRFYAVSDDRGQLSPPRFYTLKLILNSQTTPTQLEKIEIQGVTSLKTPVGDPFAANIVDPEGIVVTPAPQPSVFISSEGIAGKFPPSISEFDLNTGVWQQTLPIPAYFLSNPNPEAPRQGIGSNLGFESLTLNPSGDRLFTATESDLVQDISPDPDQPQRSRWLHYLIGEPKTIPISEHLYVQDTAPAGALFEGLSELAALDNGGHFLSLERYLIPGQGFGAKLFQVASGSATDISNQKFLSSRFNKIQPVRKELLLDLSTVGIVLDNLEGMAIGPRLPDGSSSLLLVSDNNFQAQRLSQFLLFRLRGV
jgi:hypothetical protein